MSTFLTRLATSRASVTILLTLAVALGGAYAVTQTRTELTPEISLPVVTVITVYPGSGPDDVVELVTRPIEQAVAATAGLERQQSVSAGGLSVVLAQYDYGVDVEEVTRDIDEAVGGLNLPEGVQAPRVAAVDVTALPVVQLSLGGGGIEQAELSEIARDVVVPELEKVDGVFEVEVLGASTPQVVVEVDPGAAAEQRVALQQLIGALQANQLSLPAGESTGDGRTLPVRVVHRFGSLEELEQLVVGVQAPAAPTSPPAAPTTPPAEVPTTPPAPPEPILLADVAQVLLSSDANGGLSRTNGEPSIGLSVSKTEEAATVEVAHAVEERLDELLDELPEGLEVVTILDQSIFIDQSIEGLVREGVLGAVFAVLVILAFLRHLPTTLVAAVSIPLSVLIALGALKVGDLTLNIITLGALAVAVGRVVDDSIVVLENIYRHVKIGGEPPRQAVITATGEVASAITSSTITTVAVFVPLGLVGGLVGQLFLPFAITVTVALLASLLVALTVIPVLGGALVGRASPGEHPDGPLQRGYVATLRWALASRVLVLGLAAASLAGAGLLVPAIPTAFLPAQSDKFVVVNVRPDPGLTREALVDALADVEAGLDDDDEVTDYQSTLGASGGLESLRAAIGGQGAGSASIYTRLVPEADLTAAAARLQADLADRSGDVSVTVENPQASLTNRIQLTVSADDEAAARAAAGDVLASLEEIDGLFNLSSDAAAESPEIVVRVDPQAAAGAGLTTAQVAQQVRTLLAGQELGEVRIEGEAATTLLVRGDPAATASLEAIRDLPLVGQAGPVTVGQLADVTEETVPTQVSRVDVRPAVSISADVTADDVGAVTAAVDEAVAELDLPSGVEVESGGVASQMRDSFANIGLALVAAVILVYLVMVIAFGSLVDPFIILFSIPLAAVGALVALFVTGRPLGLSSMIGILMLVGIVVTNAIVLLDFVEQARARGARVREALLEAGRIRVRPILMTALATILALVPLSLALNEGAIIAAELATVVIGGLVSSTLLTLVVVPVIYSFVKRDEAPREAVAVAAPAAETEWVTEDVQPTPAASDRTETRGWARWGRGGALVAAAALGWLLGRGGRPPAG